MRLFLAIIPHLQRLSARGDAVRAPLDASDAKAPRGRRGATLAANSPKTLYGGMVVSKSRASPVGGWRPVAVLLVIKNKVPEKQKKSKRGPNPQPMQK